MLGRFAIMYVKGHVWEKKLTQKTSLLRSLWIKKMCELRFLDIRLKLKFRNVEYLKNAILIMINDILITS